MNQTSTFTLGQVFSYTFKLFGKDFWKMLLAVVLTFVVVLIPVAVFAVSIAINPRMFGSLDAHAFMRNPFSFYLIQDMLIMYIVIIVVALLVSPYTAGTVLAFSSSRLQGRPLAFKEAFSFATQNYGKLLLTVLASFVLVLPLIALYFWFYSSFLGSMTGLASGNFSMSGLSSFFAMMPLIFLLSIVYYAAMIILGIAFNFGVCVTVNEGMFGFRAVFKGFKLLFRGGFWRSVGHFLVMGLALAGAGLVFGLLIALLAIPIALAAVVAPVLIALLVLLILAFSGSVYPFELTYTQLMYYNSRLKVDGSMF